MKKLLFVDDDDVFRNRTAVALEKRGFDVTTAFDISSANERLSDLVPDFAILDLRMPDGSGMELVEKVRSMGENIRIVVLTGFGSISNAMEAVKHGANDYLTKPADADQITNALHGKEKRSHRTEMIPSLDFVEWEHIQRILTETDGNISETARLLGIDRRTLQRKLAKFAPNR